PPSPPSPSPRPPFPRSPSNSSAIDDLHRSSPALSVWRVFYQDFVLCQLRAQRVRPSPVSARPCRGPLLEHARQLGCERDSVVFGNGQHAVEVPDRGGCLTRISRGEAPLGHPPIELAHKVENGRESFRDVEVVVEGGLERR